MILEALAIAAGAVVILSKSSSYWRGWLLRNPFMFDLGSFVVLLMIHGGSAEGAIIATLSAGLLSTVHYYARKYYGVIS